MNRIYVNAILLQYPDTPLLDEAVARLLFDGDAAENRTDAAQIVAELQPATAVGAALREAQRRRKTR